MTIETLEPPPLRARGDARSGRGRAAGWTSGWLREPLVHFFAAGLVLYAVAAHHRAETDQHRIVVTPQAVQRLADGYQAEYGSPPSRRALSELVDRWVDEEVLFREGQARGLDRDDEIIRRRVVQKMQFVEQDLAAPAEPTEADLAAWYQAHKAQYATPATVSFSHVYFADGAGGPQVAHTRAEAALAGLADATARAPERGDPFPDLYDYAGFGPEAARRLFGDTELARQLFQVPPGRWAGPFRSSYGWHLVRVSQATPGEVPPLAEVRERVRADLVAARQDAANQRGFEALKARYAIVRQDQKP